MAQKGNTPNTTSAVPGLSLDDVQALLDDFRQLQTPTLDLPERDPALWAQAKHKFKQCRLKRMPPEILYRGLDPGYAEKEAEFWDAQEKKVGPTRKRLDHLLRYVKISLLQLSEMDQKTPVEKWGTYTSAVETPLKDRYESEVKDRYKSELMVLNFLGTPIKYCDMVLLCKPPSLNLVIQDLERIRAKLVRQQQKAPKSGKAELRITDAAQILHKHRGTVKRWADRGILRDNGKKGSDRRVVREDVLRLAKHIGAGKKATEYKKERDLLDSERESDDDVERKCKEAGL